MVSDRSLRRLAKNSAELAPHAINMSTIRSSGDEKPQLDEKQASQFIEDVDQTNDSIIRERKSKFASGIDAAMYEEALEKYGEDGSIDPEREKKLVR
jgi:hypothetical protein